MLGNVLGTVAMPLDHHIKAAIRTTVTGIPLAAKESHALISSQKIDERKPAWLGTKKNQRLSSAAMATDRK
jgi:hypothetical protein